MPDQTTTQDPTAPIDIDAYLARFDWHPEPELIGFRDPAASRAALAALGTETWQEALTYLYGIATERAMGDASAYAEARRRYYGSDPAGPRDGPAPAPAEPMRAMEVVAEYSARLSRGLMNSQHPRQFGYFTPPPLPMSIMGELLAQVANQGVDVWHAGPFAAFAEEEVIRWLCDLVGYGEGSFGLLTSGGVMANFMGMTLARDLHLGRLRGLSAPPRGKDLEGARVYTSDQTHFSIARALDELGFPPDTLVVLPADDDFHLRGEPVAAAIARDRAKGLTPFAIAAVAGSTNTGSVDAVGELADVAEAEGLWLHVDAAYGGGARLSERDRDRVTDLDRADSVTVDPHKWFFQAYDIGALVVQRREDLRQTFHRTPEYYRHPNPENAPLNWFEYSIEGTRRFRALKLWLSWKHLGTSGFARLIEHNVDLAAYLVARCREASDFEVVPDEPELSVVCFRHLPEGLEGEALDAYQDRLQLALEASGEAWVSTTRIRDATYLRAGIVNYLSSEADVDRMLDALRRLSTQAADTPPT
jgi:aromatic-L-amino-acid decarboxylase